MMESEEYFGGEEKSEKRRNVGQIDKQMRYLDQFQLNLIFDWPIRLPNRKKETPVQSPQKISCDKP